MKFKPELVNLGDTRMSMDMLHIEMIFEATKLLPNGGVAVEIGSYCGASTSALVQAMDCGYLNELHIIETRIRPELLNVLNGCKYRDRIHIHDKPSHKTDIVHADMVVIDGDHNYPAVIDLAKALEWGADIIISHDSIELPSTVGSNLVYRLLYQMTERNFLHDNKEREGMKTERGLVISTARHINIEPLIRLCSER